jgi:hypothetical protein
MVWITKAEYIEDYKIHVTFNDDESGILDLKEVIYSDKRKVFRELVDITKFKEFKVDFDTIVWRNGLDLTPEYLNNFLKQSQHAV